MQTKSVIIVGFALLIAAVAGAGLWAYEFVLGETESPSGPILAIPLAVNTEAPPTAAPVPTSQPEPTAVEAGASQPGDPVEPTAAPASAPQATGLVIFQIVPEQSQVRFSIYEELNGQPKTVVGASNQVAGQVAVDLDDLSQVQVGVIQVNARTFTTDSERRNRAIRNFILQTDRHEFITFTPTAITGLSGPAQPGQPFAFQIAGDLTIRSITQPAVFTATAQGESTSRLTGTAATVVKRGDYNLTIPNVPNVANVGEEVTLEIDFVAEAITRGER